MIRRRISWGEEELSAEERAGTSRRGILVNPTKAPVRCKSASKL